MSRMASHREQFGTNYTFPFEDSFDVQQARTWFNANWTMCFKFSIGYIIFVFLAKKFMENKKAYDLRVALILWSSGLSLFSLYGAARVVPELLATLTTSGWKASICNNDFLSDSRIEYVMYLFAWSKVFEFADTAFIIFRGKNLIFLHWYHHATALLYAWYGYVDMGRPSSPYRWMASMNYVVHFIMYGYYAISASGYRVPRSLAQAITSLQILQMVVAVVAISHSLLLKASGDDCAVTTGGLWLGLALYGSYAILFTHFFIKAYLSKPKPKSS
ncbi:Elongation of very long chain fatty acids protein 6 [Halotydeus destructor]|nr:Elongation of very long chain fatty acids protein 6 [Halotydeus destructor]